MYASHRQHVNGKKQCLCEGLVGKQTCSQCNSYYSEGVSVCAVEGKTRKCNMSWRNLDPAWQAR